jgi:hypothetical protein
VRADAERPDGLGVADQAIIDVEAITEFVVGPSAGRRRKTTG